MRAVPARASSVMSLLAVPEDAPDTAGDTRCCAHHTNCSNPNSSLECCIGSRQETLFVFNRVCRSKYLLPHFTVDTGRRKLSQVFSIEMTATEAT